MSDPRFEVVRDALREFAYRPGQPVFGRYEAATAALAGMESELQRYRSLAEDLALWEPGTKEHSAALDALIGMATRV